MFCGNCFRDNAVTREMVRQGHAAMLLPLYLPITLEESDQEQSQPIQFSGINVFLDQVCPPYRRAPNWLRKLFRSRSLLNLTSTKAAKTRAEDVGPTTVSMLRGEEGNQSRELEEFVSWLATDETPDAICLSNVMLIGFAKTLRENIETKIICTLQGEDSFLDALPEPYSQQAWQEIANRTSDIDLFIAPSYYYADVMKQRLNLPANKIEVVYNGVDVQDFKLSELPTIPTIGYFARMCPQKGLDILVNAFIQLKQANPKNPYKLKIGGGCGPGDKSFVEQLKRQIARANIDDDVSWHPNLSKQDKIEFLRDLSILSVPARYGEGFGLYLAEAWASGVAVIQPRHAAFTELIEETEAGWLFDPENPKSLADALREGLEDKTQLKNKRTKARVAAESIFNLKVMTEQLLNAYRSATL